ncbi:MAG TPA: hypothetical protein VFU30_11925 [Gaiellaceae bacterium]|nr:hypothetical protein [Gaiellaceae bacterium]
MPLWGAILLIAGLSALAVASVYAIVHHTHRRLPRRQAAHGDATDISTPLPKHVVRAADSATTRESREQELNAVRGVTTYEIARGREANSPTEVVGDLPPAEIGEVIFHQGQFWRVDAIEQARSEEADGRLIVSHTTNVGEPQVR